MQSVPDFSFLTELAVSSERTQSALQEAYEHALRAEKNIEVNPERFCSYARESARYLTKAFGSANGLPAPDSYGLQNYATDRKYEEKLSGDLSAQLTYLNRQTSLSKGPAKADEQINLLQYLYSYAQGVYRELGGVPGKDKKITLTPAPRVNERFSQASAAGNCDQLIDEILSVIIPASTAADEIETSNKKLQEACLDAIKAQNREIDKKIEQLSEIILGKTDADHEQIEQELQKMRQDFNRKLQAVVRDTKAQNAEQARSLRQIKELLDQLLVNQSKQSLNTDDLIARLISLEDKEDRIEKRIEDSIGEMKQYSEDLAKSIVTFYQNNRQPLEKLGESVRELCTALVKAGKVCLDTTTVFVQKAAASAEKIRREKMQQADQLVREAKNRAGQTARENAETGNEGRSKEDIPIGRKTSSIDRQPSFAGTDLLQRLRSFLARWDLAKWCRKLSVSESFPLHRLLNTFCVTGLLLYLLLFYVLASDHVLSFPPFLARLSGCLWYALSFLLIYVGRLSLYLTQIRIVAGLLDRFLRKLPFANPPFWKKAVVSLAFAMILYGLTRYCHDHFYFIAFQGFGWKQMLLAGSSGEICNMVRWCLSIWSAR